MLITRENINNGSKMPKMRVIPLVAGGTMLTDGRSVVADLARRLRLTTSSAVHLATNPRIAGPQQVEVCRWQREHA